MVRLFTDAAASVARHRGEERWRKERARIAGFCLGNCRSDTLPQLKRRRRRRRQTQQSDPWRASYGRTEDAGAPDADDDDDVFVDADADPAPSRDAACGWMPPPHDYSLRVSSLKTTQRPPVVNHDCFLDLDAPCDVSPLQLGCGTLRTGSAGDVDAAATGAATVADAAATSGDDEAHGAAASALCGWLFEGRRVTEGAVLQLSGAEGVAPTPSPAAAAAATADAGPAACPHLVDAAARMRRLLSAWETADFAGMAAAAAPLRYRTCAEDNDVAERACPVVYVRGFAVAALDRLLAPTGWLGVGAQLRRNLAVVASAVDALLQGSTADTVPTARYVHLLQLRRLRWLPPPPAAGAADASRVECVRRRLAGRLLQFVLQHVAAPLLRRHFPSLRGGGAGFVFYTVPLWRRLWAAFASRVPGFAGGTPPVPIPLPEPVRSFAAALEVAAAAAAAAPAAHASPGGEDDAADAVSSAASAVAAAASQLPRRQREAATDAAEWWAKEVGRCRGSGSTPSPAAAAECAGRLAAAWVGRDAACGACFVEGGHVVSREFREAGRRRAAGAPPPALPRGPGPVQLLVKRRAGPRWARALWAAGTPEWRCERWDPRAGRWDAVRRSVQQRGRLGGQRVAVRRSLLPVDVGRLLPFLRRVASGADGLRLREGVHIRPVRDVNSETVRLLQLCDLGRVAGSEGEEAAGGRGLGAVLRLLKRAMPRVAPHGYHLLHTDASQAYDAITLAEASAVVAAVSRGTPAEAELAALFERVVAGRASGVPQGWFFAEVINDVVQRRRTSAEAYGSDPALFPPFFVRTADDVLGVFASRAALDRVRECLASRDATVTVKAVAGPAEPGGFVRFMGLRFTPRLEVWPCLGKYASDPLWRRACAFPVQHAPAYGPVCNAVLAAARGEMAVEDALAVGREAAFLRALPAQQRLEQYPVLFATANLGQLALDTVLNAPPVLHRTLMLAAAVGWAAFFAAMAKSLHPRYTGSERAMARCAAALDCRLRAAVAARLPPRLLKEFDERGCLARLLAHARLGVARVASEQPGPGVHPLLATCEALVDDAEVAAAVAASLAEGDGGRGCRACAFALRDSTSRGIVQMLLRDWVAPFGGIRGST
eukprot:Rhum_TRINITY_DN11991_c0_g1::Rhum_TRINITY_DN11991_c0_g1_i1::g.48395::m.48395